MNHRAFIKITCIALAVACITVFAAPIIAPTNWVSSYNYTAGNVQIPTATWTNNGAVAADLDNANGDIREITKAYLEEINDYEDSIAGTTNAPAYMSIAKTQKLNSSGELVTTFTVTFISDLSGSSVKTE